MNILKNMEAVFLVTAALALSASYVANARPATNADADTPQAYASNVPVVVVTAKRLSAAEKAQSLRDENQLATNRGAALNQI